MYVKIFQSIFDGSIARDWQVRVVFQDFLILADKFGVVDMTADAIAARTRVPLNIVEQAIEKLEQPDPDSRRPDSDGRRIERLNATRNWGWKIVNFQYYHALRTLEEKREYDRCRLKELRDAKKQENLTKSTSVAGCRNESSMSSTQTHTHTDTKKNIPPKLPSNHVVIFENTWKKYPRKVEKQAAFKAWKARIKQGESAQSMDLATKAYASFCASEGTEPRYIKHGSTFFGPNNPWKDWVSGPPEETQNDDGDLCSRYGLPRSEVQTGKGDGKTDS